MFKEGFLSFEIDGDSTINALSLGLMGACVGETRTILFPNQEELGYTGPRGHVLYPLLGEDINQGEGVIKDNGMRLFFEVTVTQIAEAEDFALFKHINDGEINRALKSLGSPTMDVGMVDGTGQSPLMASIAVQNMQVYATILNTQVRLLHLALLPPSPLTKIMTLTHYPLTPSHSLATCPSLPM